MRLPLINICLSRRLPHPRSSLYYSTSARHFKVTLDNDTLYIEQPLAEALGWKSDIVQSVQLNLTGWAPHYFVIAPNDSDSDLLARATVESAHNPRVQRVLQRLKDFDATSDEEPNARENSSQNEKSDFQKIN